MGWGQGVRLVLGLRVRGLGLGNMVRDRVRVRVGELGWGFRDLGQSLAQN